MAIRSQRILASFLAGDDSRRPSASRRDTIKITLAAKAGVTASSKPPVRIFLGTESAQFRAERAFVWSIQRVRDPARVYEIHLMKDFAGFERRWWLTGFTNYRFAIPELAGCRGRAIYNDADQIYLEDPAHLFDTPMGEHGVLSINDRDTSVMLIDCERMAALWNWETARTTKNRELEARMRAQPGLWGELDAGWNARDEEYVPGESHLVHYTTIHTQPWRPSPRDYVYRANVAHDIWMNIEREADGAGFLLFDAEHPSPLFASRSQRVARAPVDPQRLDDYRRLVTDARATSLYYCGYDDLAELRRLANGGLAADSINGGTPQDELGRGDVDSRADVVVADGLSQLPDLDLGWVLDRLFARANRAVIVSVSIDADVQRLCPADPYWWYAQMDAASARWPDRHWRLVAHQRRFGRSPRRWRWSGGALLQVPPRTWALLHYKTGHRSQTLGIAEALGWPYETREITRSTGAYLRQAVRGALSSKASLPGGIQPPWPDLVIASGWLPALVARWVADRNFGNTRLVLLGRRGGPVGEAHDIAVACRHYGLVPNPRHIETVLPPNKVDEQRLAEAAQRWPALYADKPGANVAFLVGGTSAQHELSATAATRLLDQVQAAVEALDGSLAVLTSRRTGEAASAALRTHAAPDTILEPWQPAAGTDNPYLGYLATADILVVTGESESMLAEAVATGKPVYICALPERPPQPRQRISDWVYHQAQTDRFNARGSRRPQQGLQYLCARLVEQRVFLPRRDMGMLYQRLTEENLARMFDGNLEHWQPPAWREIDWLAQQIRDLLAPREESAGLQPPIDTANESERRAGRA